MYNSINAQTDSIQT